MSDIFIMLYFKEAKNVIRMQQKKKKDYADYGEGTMDNQVCQKWFAKFCAARQIRGS